METPKNSYHYDYESLDKFLTELVNPQKVSDCLDDLVLVLMTHVCLVPNAASKEMLELYGVLSDLRDVFKDLSKRAD